MLTKKEYSIKISKTVELIAGDDLLKEIKQLKKSPDIDKSLEELDNLIEKISKSLKAIWNDFILPLPGIQETRLKSYIKNNREEFKNNYPKLFELAHSFYSNLFIGPYDKNLEEELRKLALEELEIILKDY